MNIEWSLILKSSWQIFWPITLYSYFVCSLVGLVTGIRTKNNWAIIGSRLEAFIISPFYVATFFSSFSVLFFYHGAFLFHSIHSNQFISVFLCGLIVLLSHLVMEVLESGIFQKKPLRILEDHDAIRLAGIYLILILMTTVIIALVG